MLGRNRREEVSSGSYADHAEVAERQDGRDGYPTEEVHTIAEEVMSRVPVTMLTTQACPVTRVVQSRDKPNVAAVWDYSDSMFHQVPRGEDRWFTTWDHLLIRFHGRPRTRAFHPLHRSTPYPPYPLTRILAKEMHYLVPNGGTKQACED